MQSKKRFDGIIGPVFQKSSEVDWSEVRSEWENLTGEKLHYSWWKGIFFWFILVGIFVYLQAGFFNLYFSQPYLEKKVTEIESLVQNLKSEEINLAKINQIESSLLELQKAAAGKGQFFVLLSFNPLFEGKVIDLSRFLLAIERVKNLQNLALDVFENRPKTFQEWNFDFWLVRFYFQEIKKELALIEEPKINIYYHLFSSKFAQLETGLDFTHKHLSEILWALGQTSDRRYLFLFPNNKEERNWGGFSGTYGELEISRENFNFFNRDIYYLDWLVRGDDIESTKKPEEAKDIPADLMPDQKIFSESQYFWWYLRNAATSLDFKTNARRAAWIYQNVHKQNQVDGVIALTPNLIIDILKIIGPLEMPDYKIIVSADNFREIIEYKVEIDNPFKKKKDRSQSPKQILVDLAPKFLQKVEDSPIQEKIKIFEAILRNLQEKQIIVYFEESEVQKIVEEFNFGARLRNYPYDYLAVYSSNLNGLKSSLGIERKINLFSSFTESNLVKNQLNLEYFYKINPDRFGGPGEFLVEIALPEEATLQSAKKNGADFISEIQFSQEGDKKICFFPMNLDPGQKINYAIEYTLPHLVSGEWGLLFQKQPGVEAVNFQYNLSGSKVIKVPEDFNKDLVLRNDQEFKIDF